MRPFQRFQARIKCELHFQCHCSVWLEREFVLLFVHYLPFTVFKCTCIIFLQDFQLFFFCVLFALTADDIHECSWNLSPIWFIFYIFYCVVTAGVSFLSFTRMTKDTVHPSEDDFRTTNFVHTFVLCHTLHGAAGSEQWTVCTTLNLKLSTRFSTLNNVNNVNYAVLQSWILTKNAAYTFVRD